MLRFSLRRLTPVLAASLALPLFLAACKPEPAVQEATGTPQPNENADASGGTVYATGPFDLPDPAVGLTDLGSYQATLVQSFEGLRDGQPEQWTRTVILEASRDPVYSQVTVDTTGQLDGEALVPRFLAEVDGVRYERQGDDACVASIASMDSQLADDWQLAGQLNGLFGADEAGTETVNGVATSHYTFDERALMMSDVATSTGEVWVATDGGYVVRYRLSIEGEAEYFGEGLSGTATWAYDLSDIGQPGTVEVPEDCPPGLVDAPLLDDADAIHQLPGVTYYTSAASLPDAIAFYQDQLPALGWVVSGEPIIGETLATLDFTQGEDPDAQRSLSVMAVPGTTGTVVWLVLGDALNVESAGLPFPMPTP
jgi:hypothetical protein